ncbi:P83/100 family protein [Borrelia sp. BU AG58]|uniref:P83/100 family protein n=1 Tax=Borrelia sp. BU AG58 TaxID=2887345 RepID=UPI001E43FDF4|nr:P83/100 family protein [Borrelia sp. BU AG58]UER67889.1 P83/100 family protein [Borrelia sp. BU AG58]
MKRIWVVFVSFFAFLNFFALHSREIDEQRLKDFVDMDLEFVNYRGSYDSTNTYEQIVGIGEFLARNLVKDRSNYYNKYYVNRYIDDQDVKSSADVFLIGDRSVLDSILNLRRILMGYLMEAFGYSRDSAELLAKAITIYNAVYRGDLGYYGEAYIEPSLKDATKDNVGLSRVYSQWAGKTLIFIPLRRDILSGDVGSEVDLDRIVTERVIASLLDENDSGGTDFARDITDVQDEIHDMDQERVDIETDSLKSIEEELNETIEDLREQLEKSTSEEDRDKIERQIKEKREERDALEKKGSDLKGSQEKLDKDQDRIDAQRGVVKDKLQEGIDDENKDKNLPKPGDIGSPSVDEKEELNETIEDLREQLEKSTSEEDRDKIERQIKEKREERDALEKKGSDLKGSQEKLDKDQDRIDAQRGVVKDKLQEGIDDENKDKNLPKPGDIGSPSVDEKEELNEQGRGIEGNNRGNDNAEGKSDTKLLDSKMQSGEQAALDKASGGGAENKSVFLEVLDPSTNLGVLQFIDPDGNKLEEPSQYGIRRYGVYEREDDLVVIKLCSGIAKLQLIDKTEDLKVESESQFELSRDSSLFVDSKMILVVVRDNNVWKLAKFSSKDLSDFILSEDEVLPFTSFTVGDEYVYLQNSSGKVVTLHLGTLKRAP